jgi:hypothetical protein
LGRFSFRSHSKLKSKTTINNFIKYPKLLLIAVTFLFGGCVTFAAVERRSYGEGGLTIKEVTKLKDGTVRIVYSSEPESMWYCPGVDSKMTDKGLVLTFVKCLFNKKVSVNHSAGPLKKGEIWKVVIVPAKGGPVFLKSRKELKKLNPKAEK